MRICYIALTITPRSPAGSTLIDIIEAMLDEGHEVTVLAHELDARLQQRVCFIHIPVLKRLGIPGELLSFHAVHLVTFAILRFVRRDKFDAVYSLDSESMLASHVTFHNCCVECLHVIRKYGLWSPVHSIGSVMTNIALFINLNFRALVEGINCKRSCHIYALTERHKQYLVNRYRCDPNRISVTPNYLQRHVLMRAAEAAGMRSSARRALDLNEDAFVLIFVAHGGWPRKGLGLLLDSLSLIEDRSNLVLLVVGGGSYCELNWYRKYSAGKRLNNVVRWCGSQSNVFPYYAAADCLVVPSYYELFSLVPLEGLAAGLPLLMTDVSGVEAVLRPGENGLLINFDPRDIALKLQLLRNDSELRRIFAQQSLAIARRWRDDSHASRLARQYATV